MNYIISDIHANIEKFRKLLSLLNLKKEDKLIFLGDYIGKNTHTQETLKLIKSLQKEYECVLLKGNHDFVWDKYLNHQEFQRQDFLLNYGGIEALRKNFDKPEELIKKNDIPLIKKCLKTYLELIPQMVDYYLVDDYLAMHAGLTKDQLQQNPLKFAELNYFLRPDQIEMDKKYLDKYRIVAGHTFLNTKPLIKKGYINIDLGAGYNKYLGCLAVEKGQIIRSDNLTINL